MIFSTKKYNNKIALIEPSGGYSGMQYYNIGMYTGLQSNSVQAYLFTTASENNYISSHYIHYYFDNVWKTHFTLLKLYNYYLGIFKSVTKAKRSQCKIVHLHQFHLNLNLVITIFICKVFFNKLLLTVHDVESFDSKSNRRSKLYSRILKIFVDEYIVHNTFSSLELKNELKVSPKIIPHGNYIPFFKELPFIKSNKKINLLFFGLIKESKGLDILLQSLIILKNSGLDFNLIIAGRPWRNNFLKYQNFINYYNLQEQVQTHLHFISENDLINYFNKSDLVILPYRKIFQSGIILKSMSLKRPVLCSNLPAFQELVKDGFNGFLFESENSNSLANKLKEIINNPDCLNAVVDNAYKMLEKDFNWNNIGLQLKDLYINTYEKN